MSQIEQLIQNEFKKFEKKILLMMESKLGEKFDKMISKVDDLTTSVSFLNKELEDVKKENKEIKEEIQSLKKRNDFLTKEIESVKTTSLGAAIKVNEMDNHLRLNNVELHGIPGTVNEKVSDTALQVLKIVDPSIVESDIEMVKRLKNVNNKDGTLRVVNPILVKFKSREKRFAVISNRRKLAKVDFKQFNINTSAVYVNENLTAVSKSLFYKASVLKKEKNWKYLWTSNGNILLKKHDSATASVIRDESDLDKLLQ